MPEPSPLVPPPAPDEGSGLPGDTDELRKQRKKAEKARDAWISFAGRIIAQVVGAAASVVLGVVIVQRYNSVPAPPADATTAASTLPETGPARARSPRRPGQVSIAVLPLANLSARADQEYFADGMTEALTAALAPIDGLTVISRTSTMRYKTERRSVPEIARALGVDLVVEGSVLHSGDQVRITAQLIDGSTDEHLWAQSYTRGLRDVIRLQDEVASAIGRELKGTITRRAATTGRAVAGDVDPAVYDLYLRGRHAWHQRTPESLRTAIDYFSQAIVKDPSFALAHAGLADAYLLQSSPALGLRDVQALMAQAKASAVRALDLDPDLAEAHTSLGGAIFFGERNLADAEQKLRHALEINPSYAVAHQWLGVLLGEQGRYDEALTHSDAAIRLSPLEGAYHQGRSGVLYLSHRYADSIASSRRALELSPDLPMARALLVKALTLNGAAADAWAGCAGIDPASEIEVLVACHVAGVRAGRTAEAAALHGRLEALQPTPDVALAQVDAALGDYAQAFTRLERLAAGGNLPPGLASDPLFEGLRKQPQWAALARRARL